MDDGLAILFIAIAVLFRAVGMTKATRVMSANGWTYRSNATGPNSSCRVPRRRSTDAQAYVAHRQTRSDHRQ
jgi:hypothetical protein